MDYLNEAANAEKFRDMHKHNKMIAVPKIYKKITSRRISTMSSELSVKSFLAI